MKDQSGYRIIFGTLLVLMLNVTGHLPIYAQDWTLRKDEDSIQVYTAFTENSKFKRIRADFTIRASRKELFEKLLNADKYVDWQYNTLQSRVLERVNASEILYYNEVDAPWPVSNRDMVIRLKIEELPHDPVFRILTWSEPDRVAIKDGIIRVPSSKGEWKVTELHERKLKVRFEMQIDPGGDVPAWLVNITSSLAPHQTFLNLKKMLE